MSNEIELGQNQSVIIVLPDGKKVQGIITITGIEEQDSKIIGIEYTIPNMHVRLERDKIVKSFTGGIGTEFRGSMGSGGLYVTESLKEVKCQ